MISSLLEKDGFQPFDNGKKKKGPCFKCGGKDRLSLWDNEVNFNGQYRGGRFFCNQCLVAGDAVDYLRMTKDMTFRDACAFLGLDLLPGKSNYPRTEKKIFTKPLPTFTDPTEVWQQKAENFTRYCHDQLLENDQVLAWLLERGISEKTVRKYRLGWNPETMFRPLSLWGLREESNPTTGKQRRQWLPDGLVIIFSSRPGEISPINRIRIRMNEPVNGCRYAIIKGSSMKPMVFWDNQDAVVVVESELDAMLIQQEAWDMVGVIAMGSAQGKPDADLDARLKVAETVLCALDNDQAGDREAYWWSLQYQGFKRLRPYEKDPGEMVKAGKSIQGWIGARL